ncbi:BatD family protein [Methanolobus sp. ZRKC3]|uniref:hypothetical protein n=1 Tax=Methanolobus sp. ZRKC3 TaxID=3125786 RepID=UPI003249E354
MSKNFILICLIIISLSCTTALAYDIDDIEWDDNADASGTLGWGDTLESGDYLIKAEDFNTEGYVSVSISRDGMIKEISPVQLGESVIYRDVENGDDIKAFVDSVTLNIDEWTGNMEDPTAAIKVYKRGIPEMNIEIETEEDTYDPRTISYPYITATIEIENEGDAKAYEMDVEIDPFGMELVDGKLRHHLISIDEDEVLEPIEVKLKIPHYWEETDIDLKVTTFSKDINGYYNEDSETKTLTIEPAVELVIMKSITEDIYMDETAHVSVSVWNNGIYSLNSVTVENPVIEHLELQDNVNQQLVLSFSPGETKAKVFDYTLKPVKTGSFSVPATKAEYTDPTGKMQSYASETPSIEIEGPVITLTKSVTPSSVNPGDQVTVKVKLENTGTHLASVTSSETLPEEVSFVSGDLNFKEVIDSRKSFTYSYVIETKEVGEFKLPATTASFIDFEEYKGEKISNMPVISVVAPVEENAGSSSGSSQSAGPSDTSTYSDSENIVYHDGEARVQPGFEGTMLIFVLLCVYAVSKRNNKQ